MDAFYLIPSETYREFLLKNHIELTVSQKAKIISFYAPSHEERVEAFEELLSSQEISPVQREQLETLISREKAFMRKEPGDSEFEEYLTAEDRLYGFVDFPECFRNGDIVKPCYRRWAGEFGILRIDPEREKNRKELLSKGMYPDDEEYVEFYKDGIFCHDHLLPTELEFVMPSELPEEIRVALKQAPGQSKRQNENEKRRRKV